MRLYPKKLRSIEGLEREKKKLLRESKRMEEDGFLSVETIFKKKKGDSGGSSNALASILDFIPVSNPVIDILLKFIKRKVSNKQSATSAYVEPSPKKNRLKSLAIEFIGGYLKWKAIELSYKGLKRLLGKKKNESI